MATQKKERKMKKMGNTLHLSILAMLAGVAITTALLVRNEFSLFWKAQLLQEEKALFSKSVDACLEAATVTWEEDGVTLTTPHLETFEFCMSQKEK